MLGFAPLSSVPLSSLPATGAQAATGFVSGSFGTPLAGYARTQTATGAAPTTQVPTPKSGIVQPATGFTPTLFGTGFGQNLQRPTGFQSTAVGDPRIFPYSPPPILSTTFGTGRLFPYHVAPGINATGFGSIVGWQHFDVEWNPPKTKFGTPSTPTNRTAEADGFVVTHVGTPSKSGHAAPNVDRICRADGFRLTQLGHPVAAWSLFGGAQGFATGATGSPLGAIGQRATGFGTASLGDPSAAMYQRAAGFSPSNIGFALAVMTQRMTGAQFLQQFGLPESDRSNTYKVYSINASVRIGRPKGFSRINYPAAGFCGSIVGSPSSKERSGVLHIPPVAEFGHPALVRNPFCERTLKVSGARMVHYGRHGARMIQPASGANVTQYGTPTT